MVKIGSSQNFRLRFEDWEGSVIQNRENAKVTYEEHIAVRPIVKKSAKESLIKTEAKREFLNKQSEKEFEEENRESILGSEVNCEPESMDDKIARVLARAESLTKEDRDRAYADETLIEDYLTGTLNLKSYSLEQWIYLVSAMKKSVAPLVRMIDTQYCGIAYGSPILFERGITTVNQFARLMEYEDQKRNLINIYVLNKMWAGLMKNEQEREAFVALFQRAGKLRSENRSEIRVLYRKKEIVMKRIREFCLARGFDAEWFYDHFGQVNAVRNIASQAGTVE